jgi:hypothetical protein
MKCFRCDVDDSETKTDWLNEAEESVEVFYCKKCGRVIGIGNII